MLQYILKVLIQEIIKAVTKAASDYFALQQLKKEKAEEVKEIFNEKDPQVKASRITSLLSTSR